MICETGETWEDMGGRGKRDIVACPNEPNFLKDLPCSENYRRVMFRLSYRPPTPLNVVRVSSVIYPNIPRPVESTDSTLLNSPFKQAFSIFALFGLPLIVA